MSRKTRPARVACGKRRPFRRCYICIYAVRFAKAMPARGGAALHLEQIDFEILDISKLSFWEKTSFSPKSISPATEWRPARAMGELSEPYG